VGSLQRWFQRYRTSGCQRRKPFGGRRASGRRSPCRGAPASDSHPSSLARVRRRPAGPRCTEVAVRIGSPLGGGQRRRSQSAGFLWGPTPGGRCISGARTRRGPACRRRQRPRRPGWAPAVVARPRTCPSTVPQPVSLGELGTRSEHGVGRGVANSVGTGVPGHAGGLPPLRSRTVEHAGTLKGLPVVGDAVPRGFALEEMPSLRSGGPRGRRPAAGSSTGRCSDALSHLHDA
jgi:hypothetical protein